MSDTTDTHDQPGNANQGNQGNQGGDSSQQATGTETTQQLPRTDATQQLPVRDDTTTGVHESVDTAVFGAPAPEHEERTRDDGAPATKASTPATPAAWPPPVPPRPSGPHAPPIVLGLICLAVAGIVLAQELGNLSVDWGDVGPLGFVAVGAVLVVLGAVGLLSSRRRNPQS